MVLEDGLKNHSMNSIMNFQELKRLCSEIHAYTKFRNKFQQLLSKSISLYIFYDDQMLL